VERKVSMSAASHVVGVTAEPHSSEWTCLLLALRLCSRMATPGHALRSALVYLLSHWPMCPGQPAGSLLWASR
jgi:hypothetical protein